MARHHAATALLLAISACSAPSPPACDLGTGMTVFTLYFGEGIRGRPDLTAQEWRQFLDDTVSIDLPNGYTVSDANGAWLNPKTHATVSEPTKVLTVALPPGPDSLAAVNRVRNAYQIRFHQQLVGMTNQPACGDF